MRVANSLYCFGKLVLQAQGERQHVARGGDLLVVGQAGGIL